MPIPKQLVLCSALSSLLVAGGCAFGPVDQASNDPPRLVSSFGSNTPNVWDAASAFGPVPGTLQAEGDALCHKQGLKRALGYHPRAEHPDGTTYDGGGFLCARPDTNNG